MNTQLRLVKSVARPHSNESVEFVATAVDGGVNINFGPNESQVWEFNPVPWEHITNPEYLANVFWGIQVWEFRVVLKLLGEMSMANAAIVWEEMQGLSF